MEEGSDTRDEFLEITQAAISKFRERLLDLSNRNNFINLSLNPRSNRNIRLIDELPDRIYQQLDSGEEFELIPLPLPKDEPEDEQTDEFLSELEFEKLNNENYKIKVEEMGDSYDESNEQSLKLIRKLKDDLRDRLNLPKRISPDTVSIEEYAKSLNIIPNYEVPIDEGKDDVDERHQDKYLQTLFYPNDLERKSRLLNREYQRFISEKGTNTLYISFGCLEWYELKTNQKRISPLLLYPIKLKEEKSASGRKYVVYGSESEIELNLSLSKRLKKDFGIELPCLSEDINTPELFFKILQEKVIEKKEKWKIRRFINITIHQYSKLAMYEDLDPEAWKKNGYILGSQKGAKDLFTGSEDGPSEPNDYDLDKKDIIEKVPVIIDNVDSSQYSTILDALGGNNLVVQGPPGTGKSTTIANILASLMHEQKKVLFMSEKKAALDVVYKKLKDKDLGPFVFKLSAINEKKTDFINELKIRLETEEKNVNKEDIGILNGEYHKQIEKISRYKKFLSKKYFNLEITGYELLVKFAKSKFQSKSLKKSYDEFIPFESITDINKKKLFELYGSLDLLESTYNSLIKNYNTISQHPWYGLTISENNPFKIEKLTKDINSLKENTEEKKNLHSKFNQISNLKIDYNIHNTNIFDAINFSDKINFDNKYICNFKNSDLIALLKGFKEKLNDYLNFQSSKNAISKLFELGENLKTIEIDRYSRFIKNSGFFAFLFDQNYKEAKNFYKRIKLDGKFNKKEAPIYLDKIKHYLETLPKSLQLEIDLDTTFNDLDSVINTDFKGKDTSPEIIDELCQIIDNSKMDYEMIIYVTKNKNNLSELKDLISKISEISKNIDENLSRIDEFIDKNTFFINTDNLDIIYDKVSSIDLLDAKSLDNFIKFNYYKDDLHPLINKIINSLVSSNADISHVRIAFDYIMYKSLAELLFDQEKDLHKLNVIDFENEIEKFKNLDQSFFELKRDKLINNLLDIKPTVGVNRGKASDFSEISLIEREITKQKAHIPFRQLIERAGNALGDIKPCFMLSPISLSQITDVKPNMFDVLIIDEASQMRIEDSLGGILRSNQIIIVGDPEQLPPSNSFDANIDIDNEGIVDDDESILDLAIAKFKPKRMLKWHYRSRHESLINFSNKYFYNNSLIIPPSAKGDFAIKHNKVEGIYNASTKEGSTSPTSSGGTNEIECKAISESVTNFMKNNPDKSCLVVTMNIKQRELIIQQVDLITSRDQAVREYMMLWEDTMEPFVVKNLENVQGDERDYIFISTLFGPGGVGQKPMQRFGPINNKKGHRRLNVLFTRAKEGIELFTSLYSEDIRDTEKAERGRLIFKKYLEYSRNKMLESGNVTGKETDSDFEDWVKAELELSGFEVIPQVGVSGFFIDLGIKHKDYPHGYLAGVECDGATYHSSLSARDNDIVRQNILESYGWNIYRIWSTNWFKDPEKEMEKLIAYLTGIKKEHSKQSI